MDTPHIPPANPSLKSTDEYLWHFTSQENLWNILCSPNGLLAGHSMFMKDTEDCSFVRRLNAISIELGSLLVSSSNPKMDVAEYREELKKLAKSGVLSNVFIACFTTTTREPKMWMEYTKNGGFAIGFDKKLLGDELTLPDMKPKTVFFQDCEYSTFRKQDELINNIEVLCAEMTKSSNPVVNPSDFKKLQEATHDAIFSKRPRFYWEHEKRLAYVFEQGEVPKDRLRFIGAKPFVTVELSAPIATYVRCIRISPHGDVQKSRAIAHLVASSIGLPMDYVIDEKMT